MSYLDDMKDRLGLMSDAERSAVVEAAQAIVGEQQAALWMPNPGPQTDAYYSKADVLLYGGAGGGGKTDLILGLALNEHIRSLIMRRTYSTLSGITQRLIDIAGRDGFRESPKPLYRSGNDMLIEFGAMQHAGDEEDWQGRPHDLLALDETTQFLESQVRFVMGWIRSTAEGQRCRALFASNPPLGPEGEWIIGMFRPWLDLTHSNPAKPGELRWFITDDDGKDAEVDSSAPVERGEKTYLPKSRTFIPAMLADNPYLINTGYQAQLDALPEPIRSAVRDGNFMAARPDAERQVIPAAWVRAAQERWTPDGYKQAPMTCMALDPAGGGADSAEIVCRHGTWFSELISAQGEDTADGSKTAAKIVQHRRDGCPVVVDTGGGYGGAPCQRLDDNSIPYQRFNGAHTNTQKTRDGALLFRNDRALALWRLREELDPDQLGGSKIEFPPDPVLLADLTAPTFEVGVNGILIESKDKLRVRLGRSTGKGDAVMMATEPGSLAAARHASSARPVNVKQSRPAARRRSR